MHSISGKYKTCLFCGLPDYCILVGGPPPLRRGRGTPGSGSQPAWRCWCPCTIGWVDFLNPELLIGAQYQDVIQKFKKKIQIFLSCLCPQGNIFGGFFYCKLGNDFLGGWRILLADLTNAIKKTTKTTKSHLNPKTHFPQWKIAFFGGTNALYLKTLLICFKPKL